MAETVHSVVLAASRTPAVRTATAPPRMLNAAALIRRMLVLMITPIRPKLRRVSIRRGCRDQQPILRRDVCGNRLRPHAISPLLKPSCSSDVHGQRPVDPARKLSSGQRVEVMAAREHRHAGTRCGGTLENPIRQCPTGMAGHDDIVWQVDDLID